MFNKPLPKKESPPSRHSIMESIAWIRYIEAIKRPPNSKEELKKWVTDEYGPTMEIR